MLPEVVRMNTSFGDRSFAAAAPCAWNRLPDVVRNSALSEDAFAKLLKTYLLIPDELYVGRGAFDVELAPYEINLLLLLLIIYTKISNHINAEDSALCVHVYRTSSGEEMSHKRIVNNKRQKLGSE